MSKGKKEVWKLANPIRKGGALGPAIMIGLNKQDDGSRRPCEPELDRLFPYVIKLYNTDRPRRDGVVKYPHHTAASVLERLVLIEPTHSTIMWFLSSIGHMQPDYTNFLMAKDLVTLLLLSWWYAKLILV